MNPYIPRAVRIIGIRQESPDIKTFILDEKMDADPDQFIQVSVPGIGECPISISSAPGKNVEITIRKIGKVTNKIHDAKPGSVLFIRGPYGHGIPVKELKGKSLSLIGGGSGIAPLRGMIKYIENNGKGFEDTRLFFGFRSPQDIIFKQEMDNWKKRFKTFITVDTADESWRGDVGLITRLIEEKGVAKDNAAAVICGPPTMMKLIINLLKEEFQYHDCQILVSLERYMKCGIGKCGHCRINEKYICKEGPIMNYETVKGLVD